MVSAVERWDFHYGGYVAVVFSGSENHMRVVSEQLEYEQNNRYVLQ